ncbi:acyl-CoA dehydrogenase family protein [Henriciella aquimarina]|uniref:acyl-CoA dehydrogenase family protein n=1 Tax=Henriciella aquimarina TaxID=545261 RepID=UPI000A05A5AB|nr:acyl-CoA dehydrogenase family protein [Henriciella aquimarina]
MRFHLDSDQTAIQDVVHGAVSSVLTRDKLHVFIDGNDDFEPDSWQAVCELEMAGLMLPEDQGGSGLGLVEAALVIESIGKAGAPGPFIGQLLTAIALSETDNDTARSAWLKRVASGEAVATFAFGGDWLPTGWTVSVEDGKASGEVRFVPSASAAKVFLTGTEGGGLALVEASNAVSVTPLKSTDRSRPASTVSFEEATAHELFPPGDDGVQRIFDAALVLLAADALGGAQYCLDLSVEYAKERKQFGQPIGRFQALKHQLSTMALNVEPARALVWYAAHAWDMKQEDAPRSAALAKAHLCDRFVEVARDAIAAHGGIGYTWEYGLNIWFRRSVFDRVVLGSPAVHRARAADLAGW